MTSRRLPWLLLLLLPLLLSAATTPALTLPERPAARVNDYANLLPAAEKGILERRLADIEQATGRQFVVAVFQSLEGESLEDVSIRLAEKWKPGQKGKDDGLLLLLFLEDKKVRIEVGYGLEGAIPDVLAGRVIQNILRPRFREGDYAGGLKDAVDALDAAARGGELPDAAKEPKKSAKSGKRDVPSLVLLAFLFFAVAGPSLTLAAMRRRGTVIGPGGTVHRYGGFWGGGGGGGGFGGSGGGFSGGGGGFGGGGASGGW